jgi:putative endonuclease
MGATGAVGRYGERVAAAHLAADGMQVLAINWRCRQGEIDIVAVDGPCLVVCEVKTRRSAVCGTPLEAVTPVKVARLRRLAAAWLADQDRHYADVRIDVVGVHRPPRGAAVVEHLRGVC